MNPASVFVSYKLQMCKHEGGTASSRMNIIIILSGTLNRWLVIIPRGSNDKDVAAMLDELTIEANEESFVIVLQYGGNNVTNK